MSYAWRSMPVTDAGGYHVVFDGDTGPCSGSAAPRNTVSANARRFTACETARRNSTRVANAGTFAPGRRLNQNASASNPRPASTIRIFPAAASRFSAA